MPVIMDTGYDLRHLGHRVWLFARQQPEMSMAFLGGALAPGRTHPVGHAEP
ncbi:MAG: hypothetical protein GPOALKHO_001325 [Sodalis sp.]|nr:MAG: hypothetical protein GPOALKHO_001325 [Sodalis sp.]